MDNPYQNYEPEQMIFRDYLALDRTVFASERTFLSYARTALDLFSAGVACSIVVEADGSTYLFTRKKDSAYHAVLFCFNHSTVPESSRSRSSRASITSRTWFSTTSWIS